MSVLSQFSSSSSAYVERVFVTSQTFVTPISGRYLVTAIGPGGSGSATGQYSSAGGAGGLAQSLWKLPAGFSLVLTMGAPGALINAGGNVTGNDGGTTTVTGTGLTTLTANGGKGGTADYTVALANGGTASGGNIMNVTGGKGGRGGGAVGVYGVSYDGNTVSWAGAGTGGPPVTSIVGNLHHPGTGLFSGDEAVANNLFFEAYANPLTPSGGAIINGLKNGRLLSPCGGFYKGDTSAANAVSAPGCGGGGVDEGGYYTTSKAGLFAGAGKLQGTADVQRCTGGALGGGGGGGCSSSIGYASAGGCAGVIIEWVG